MCSQADRADPPGRQGKVPWGAPCSDPSSLPDGYGRQCGLFGGLPYTAWGRRGMA